MRAARPFRACPFQALFNRFYQPDFDLDNNLRCRALQLVRVALRLHWTAILYGQVGADLAATAACTAETP